MYDFAVIGEWITFMVRWLHVISGIAWIGSSFYFIALDLGLRRTSELPRGVRGEEWQVHGGGFYRIRKYLVAPDEMPAHLTWFKWESYTTWLSGAVLLIIIYWVGGEIFLLDPTRADIELWQGIVISGGSLAVGWIVYDILCKSGLGRRPTLLMLLLFVMLVIMSWGYNQVFTGRAALLHLGAFTATIMTANVFFVIIPNQKIVVDDLRNARTPDPKYGEEAKLRSTHNNYLTLPVIFLMLSIHYPLAFATAYSWLIASLVFLTGVTIRHYFNSMHARKGRPHWTWVVTTIVIIIIAWLSTAPMLDTVEEAEARSLSSHELRFASAEGFEEAFDVVLGHCSMCHAREPVWAGIHWPPNGIALETRSDVARHAASIYLQAGASEAMPPPNAVHMTEEARRSITLWYLGVTNS